MVAISSGPLTVTSMERTRIGEEMRARRFLRRSEAGSAFRAAAAEASGELLGALLHEGVVHHRERLPDQLADRNTARLNAHLSTLRARRLEEIANHGVELAYAL